MRAEVEIAVTPLRAYRAFVGQVGRWWDSSHTFFGEARRLTIDATAQGCFCETGPRGASVRHLTVVYVEPGKTIRFAGGLGPLQEMGVGGAWTVAFEPAGEESTRVVSTYRASGYRKGGLAELAAPVDGVIQEQLVRLKDFLENATLR